MVKGHRYSVAGETACSQPIQNILAVHLQKRVWHSEWISHRKYSEFLTHCALNDGVAAPWMLYLRGFWLLPAVEPSESESRSPVLELRDEVNITCES